MKKLNFLLALLIILTFSMFKVMTSVKGIFHDIEKNKNAPVKKEISGYGEVTFGFADLNAKDQLDITYTDSITAHLQKGPLAYLKKFTRITVDKHGKAVSTNIQLEKKYAGDIAKASIIAKEILERY